MSSVTPRPCSLKPDPRIHEPRLLQDLRRAIPPTTKLALRIPANRQLLSEIGLSRPGEWVELLDYAPSLGESLGF